MKQSNKLAGWDNHLFKFLPFFAGVQLLALLLTFSKSAILGLIIAMTYIMFHTCSVKTHCSTLARRENVPRGTFLGGWNNRTPTGVEHFGRKIILIIGIILFLGFILRTDTNSLFFKTLQERLPYLEIAQETITQNPFIGLGSGQFVININENVSPQKECSTCSTWNILRGRRLPADEAGGAPLEPWQFQPVHNVFLLIWSELGIIGLVLFIWFLWKLFHHSQNVSRLPRETKMFHACPVGCDCSTLARRENVPRGTFLGWWNNRTPTGVEHNKISIVFSAILLGFFIISLFDHYLWDIQQGQIMLWLVTGLLIGGIRNGTIDK